MNSPARFNLWRLKRPIVETKNNRKSLTISAFSEVVGPVKTSLNLVTLSPFYSASGITNAVAAAGTIEAWIYPTNASTSGFTNNRIIFGEFKNTLNIVRFAIALNYTTNTFGAYFDGNFVDSAIPISQYTWQHVAISWDGTNARFFINGAFVATKPYAGPITAGQVRGCNGLPFDTTRPFLGYLSELRIWNIARSDSQIASVYNKRRSSDGSLDANLTAYFPCRETAAAITNISDRVDTLFPMVGKSGASIVNDTTIVPPLKFGASFIAAQWDVTLTSKTSLAYPVVPPDDTTCALLVRWTDEDGIIQRRILFSVAGFDGPPEVLDYAGEKLPLTFTLEAWNIDGEYTAVLPEDLIIYTGETSLPTTDGDHTSQSADDLTKDDTLAAGFPLVFPIVFNSTQTYP